MADLSSFAQTVTNAGATGAVLTTNWNVYTDQVQSDAGKEYVLKLTADSGFITSAKIYEVYKYLTTNNYTSSNTDGSSAGTWAAVGSADGTVIDVTADDHCFIRFQTTQAFDVTDFNALSSNVTLSIIAVFTPAK